MAATVRFRYIGVTAEVTACQRPRCLKSGLAQTIAIMELDADGNDTGEPVFYGTDCAAKALRVRGGAEAIRKAAERQRKATAENAPAARDELALYGLPEIGEPSVEVFRHAVRVAREQDRLCRDAFSFDVDFFVRQLLARDQRVIADARTLRLPAFC